jgi:hypothetical protein
MVNAVSLYVEHGQETFHSVHVESAQRVAAQAHRAGVDRLIHISGIGADAASQSRYIRKRGEGELAVPPLCSNTTPSAENSCALICVAASETLSSANRILTSSMQVSRILAAIPAMPAGPQISSGYPPDGGRSQISDGRSNI